MPLIGCGTDHRRRSDYPPPPPLGRARSPLPWPPEFIAQSIISDEIRGRAGLTPSAGDGGGERDRQSQQCTSLKAQA
jgi:hypothetical protein